MKLGVRKPSIKKSISARTKGRAKRAIKRSVNPLYGKKGMGMINNPKKALYNKVYNKTTVGVNPMSNRSKVNRSNNGAGGVIFIIAIIFIVLIMFALILW